MLDSGAYYEDDDALLRSPPLQAVVVDPKPSITPPPKVTQLFQPPPRDQNVSSPSSRRHKRSNRRKTRPTQGDWVLLREMEPNRPDIALEASEQALNSDSDEDDVMDDDSPGATAPSGPNAAVPTRLDTQPIGLPQTAQKGLVNTTNVPVSRPPHRDSVMETDDPKPISLVVDRRASQPSTVTVSPNNPRVSTNGTNSKMPGASTLLATSPNQPTPLPAAITNGQPHDNFLATSPRLQQLTISQPRGPTTDTLPALQTQSPPRDGTVGSPNQQQQLPSFRHIDDIARSATGDSEANRANGFLHRQSVSSVGQSPTSIVRQLSISSHSPGTPFPPLSASSPVSANSELPRGDIFLRSGGGGVFGADARRPSQASEGGPYTTTLHSASTSESYQSSDGLSPATAQTPIEGRPRHMSLDGALASRLLPPPIGSGIQHIPSHGSGAFKCDYPNCNAAPFQTQYLLK